MSVRNEDETNPTKNGLSSIAVFFIKISITGLACSIFLMAIGYFYAVVLDHIRNPFLAEATAVQTMIDDYKAKNGDFPNNLEQVCETKDSDSCLKMQEKFFYVRHANGYKLVRLGTNWYEGSNDKPIEFNH